MALKNRLLKLEQSTWSDYESSPKFIGFGKGRAGVHIDDTVAFAIFPGCDMDMIERHENEPVCDFVRRVYEAKPSGPAAPGNPSPNTS